MSELYQYNNKERDAFLLPYALQHKEEYQYNCHTHICPKLIHRSKIEHIQLGKLFRKRSQDLEVKKNNPHNTLHNNHLYCLAKQLI